MKCEHNRDDYRSCPHCMGIGSASLQPNQPQGKDLPRAEGKPDLTDERGKPREWLARRFDNEWRLRSGEYGVYGPPDYFPNGWISLIEKSAYDSVCKERDGAIALVTSWDQQDKLDSLAADLEACKVACEVLKRERDEARKQPVAFRPPADDKEIFDLLSVELAAARAEVKEINDKYEFHIGTTCDKRISRMERALRKGIELITSEYCSHGLRLTECGPHNPECHAQELYRALEDLP